MIILIIIVMIFILVIWLLYGRVKTPSYIKIPKIIHQIWIGPKPEPSSKRNAGDKIKTMFGGLGGLFAGMFDEEEDN